MTATVELPDTGPDQVRQAMPKHLPLPPGEPDPHARRIIDSIREYLGSDRDPIHTTAGLRHIYYWAEHLFDESLERAKTAIDPDTRRPYTYRKIREITGFKLGTVQGRITQARRRRRGVA